MYPTQRNAFPSANVGQSNHFASGPTTATASIQVHYLWVAGRYRDLSTERGLGLASEAHSLGPIPELGDSSDHSGSRPASAHLNRTGAGTTLAQDKLGDRKINPFLDIRNFTSDSTVKAAARNAGVHGARHGSLRSYAADRLKSQELLENRISRTTDVDRLKWEAKSALLNNAHSLAVLLFARAGSLGSISSCITLTKIYASGVTRGSSPRIVVIRRDPLRALAWDVEAFRLLQRKLEPSKYGSAVYSKSSGSEAWSAESPQGLEETFRCAELLIRLLRTTESGTASLSSDSSALPDIKTQQRLKSAPSLKDTPNRRAEVRLLWDEVAGVIRWLETRLERSVALARHRASQAENVADPDDEFDHDETAEYLEALAVQLAYLRAVQSLRTLLQVRSKEAIRAAKERWAQSLAAASSSHCPAGMEDVAPLAEAGLAFIHALPEEGWREEQQDTCENALAEYASNLQEGLSELAVPAIGDETTAEKKGTKRSEDDVKAPQPSTEAANKGQPEASERPEPRKIERRRSLQEVPPVDLDSVSNAARTKQINLTQRLVGASQPAVAGLVSVEARGQQHIPRHRGSHYHNGSEDDFGYGRAPSTAGLTTASFVGNRLASPSVIWLDNGSIAGAYKNSLLAPTRDLEGFAFPRQRRPSSVVSDTPSLLFPRSGDEEDGLPNTQGGVKNSPENDTVEKPTRKHLDRKRVVSMYGITPASGHKASSSAAEGVSFPSALQQQSSPPPGFIQPHRSPSETTAHDALTNTLRNTSSNASLANPSTRSLFLSPSHGRSMSGQATEHLRKLRQQDAASTHSRMNSDAMSTLSRTFRNRNPSDAGRARPSSLLLAPSVTLRSLSTAPLPGSLQASTSPTLSRTSATALASNLQATRSESTQATSAMGSLRKMAPAMPRSPEPPGASSAPKSPDYFGLAVNRSTDSSLGRASGKAVKARPPPLSRAFSSMDPTSRPGSGPQSPISPRVPGGDSPSDTPGALSPRGPASNRLTPLSQSRRTSTSSHAQQLDIALAEAEAKSRLHTDGTCSMCQTQCENAPLTRTGQRFCSRECRVEGKKRAVVGVKGKGKDEAEGQDGSASKAAGVAAA
ncbi:hypothetical protein CF326_g3552 [Tilletia indica]|nr:hypothetical protein CF326_g3552 [Tilletia indica]